MPWWLRVFFFSLKCPSSSAFALLSSSLLTLLPLLGHSSSFLSLFLLRVVGLMVGSPKRPPLGSLKVNPPPLIVCCVCLVVDLPRLLHALYFLMIISLYLVALGVNRYYFHNFVMCKLIVTYF